MQCWAKSSIPINPISAMNARGVCLLKSIHVALASVALMALLVLAPSVSAAQEPGSPGITSANYEDGQLTINVDCEDFGFIKIYRGDEMLNIWAVESDQSVYTYGYDLSDGDYVLEYDDSAAGETQRIPMSVSGHSWTYPAQTPGGDEQGGEDEPTIPTDPDIPTDPETPTDPDVPADPDTPSDSDDSVQDGADGGSGVSPVLIAGIVVIVLAVVAVALYLRGRSS